MLLDITVLSGDGIGPEVTEQAVLVLQAVADRFGHQLQLQQKLIGGAALKATNEPLPSDTLKTCLESSAVLLGAVGSPEFDQNPGHLRPEAGLLRIRRELGAYANLRRLNPVIQGEETGQVFFRFAGGATAIWDANRYNGYDHDYPHRNVNFGGDCVYAVQRHFVDCHAIRRGV